MSDDIKFADGLFFHQPHRNAPDWVLGRMSVKPKEFIEWMRSNHREVNEEGFLNLKVNVSKAGNAYIALDNFKPDANYRKPETAPPMGDGFDEDIPF